jgi:hypothetical protein
MQQKDLNSGSEASTKFVRSIVRTRPGHSELQRDLSICEATFAAPD